MIFPQSLQPCEQRAQEAKIKEEAQKAARAREEAERRAREVTARREEKKQERESRVRARISKWMKEGNLGELKELLDPENLERQMESGEVPVAGWAVLAKVIEGSKEPGEIQ